MRLVSLPFIPVPLRKRSCVLLVRLPLLSCRVFLRRGFLSLLRLLLLRLLRVPPAVRLLSLMSTVPLFVLSGRSLLLLLLLRLPWFRVLAILMIRLRLLLIRSSLLSRLYCRRPRPFIPRRVRILTSSFAVLVRVCVVPVRLPLYLRPRLLVLRPLVVLPCLTSCRGRCRLIMPVVRPLLRVPLRRGIIVILIARVRLTLRLLRVSRVFLLLIRRSSGQDQLMVAEQTDLSLQGGVP